MAFTAAQKDKAISHLGYPVTPWTVGFISGRMDLLSSVSSEAETRIINILSQLDGVESQKNTYLSADSGVQVRIDGRVYFQGQAIADLNSQYRYLQKKLAIALNLDLPNSSQVIRS